MSTSKTKDFERTLEKELSISIKNVEVSDDLYGGKSGEYKVFFEMNHKSTMVQVLMQSVAKSEILSNLRVYIDGRFSVVLSQ